MLRRALTIAVALLVGFGITLVPASASSSTEDGYYCLNVRGKTGGFYYNTLSNNKERIPISEIHTAKNVRAKFKYSSSFTATMGGGLNANGGSWGASVSSGATKSMTISRGLPEFSGNSHRKIYAIWNYQRRQVVCVTKDPRTGQIVSRDFTPRQRYVPMSWTGNLETGAASTSVHKCRSQRKTTGVNKLLVKKGSDQAVGINWTKSYSSTATLTGIGVSVGVTAGNGSALDFETWTTSGKSWACGNKTLLSDSNILYVNAL